MKSNFKLKLLCSTLALSLLVTACGSTNSQGTEANNSVEDTQDVSVQEDEKEILSTSPDENKEMETENTEESTETLTAEELEWQNYLMADVELRLRIRAEANAEAEVVGVLEKGARATVIEKGEEWTKIQSGNVEGYVSNEFCLYGTDALNHAKKVCKVVATSNSDLLNIRANMSTDSTVMAKFLKDTSLPVNTEVTTEEGWVAVIYHGVTAYVSAEFVTLKLDIATALTMDELYAREKAQQQAQVQAKPQNKPQNSGSNAGSTQTSIYSSVIANASEYEVLAAMIWCESGNQSYECNLAVASVIMNRVRDYRFPNSVKEVVFAPGQFPPATGGILEQCLVNGRTTANCYKAAQEAMNGVDNTGGCLYFNTYKGQAGMRIGDMVFWKSW